MKLLSKELLLNTGVSEWTPAVAALSSYQWWNALYDGTQFVLLGYLATEGGYIATSTDGRTWETSSYIDALRQKEWRGCFIYDGSQYMAISYNGYIATSTDLETWTVSSSTLGSNSWRGLTYAPNNTYKYIAIGNEGRIGYSTNGTSWNTMQVTNLGNNGWTSIVFDGYRFVALGDNGHISYSPDGRASWTAAAQQLGSHNWNALTYDGTKLVALGSDGYTATATDSGAGYLWQNPVSNGNLANPQFRQWVSLVANSQKLLAVDYHGLISTKRI